MDCFENIHEKDKRIPKIEISVEAISNYNDYDDHFSYEEKGML